VLISVFLTKYDVFLPFPSIWDLKVFIFQEIIDEHRWASLSIVSEVRKLVFLGLKKWCRVMPVFKNYFRYPQTHIYSCIFVYTSQKVYCSRKKLSWIFVLSLTLVHNASKLGLLCISWYEFWYGNIPQWFRLCRSPFSLGRHFFIKDYTLF